MLMLLCALLLQDADVDRKLDDTRVTIDKTGKLAALIEPIRAAAGVNIIVDPRAPSRTDTERVLELKLKNVKARSALAWVTRLYGLEYVTQDGAVVIGAPGQLEGGVTTKLFDVAGLLSRPPDNPAPAIAIPREGQPEFGAPYEAENPPAPDQELADIIQTVIAPGTWEGPFVARIVKAGRLSVTHHPYVVAQIEEFLKLLRSKAPAMVTIDADIFELDAEAEKFFESLGGAAMSEEDTKKALEALKGARSTRCIQAFHFSCTEGQLAHVLANNSAGRALTFEARPALTPAGAVKIDFSLEGVLNEKSIAGSTTLRLRTTTVIPNRGSAAFLLPRPGAEEKTAALIVRVIASGENKDADMQLSDRSDAAVREKIAAAKLVSFEFTNVAWSKVVESLRERLGVNVVLHPDMADRLFTIKTTDLSATQFLNLALRPIQCEAVPVDEALYIGPRQSARGRSLLIAGVRDLALSPHDFQEGQRAEAAAFEPQSVATRLREAVQRDAWQDDAVARATTNGILVIRQTPEVLRDVAAYLKELRRYETVVTSVRADIVAVPAKACEDLLSGEYLVDAAAAAKLIGAAVEPAERLQLHGLNGVRLGLIWERRRTESNKLFEARSTLDVRSETTASGVQTSLRVDVVDFQGKTLAMWRASMRSSVAIPVDKAAVFKLGLVDGSERTYRLLIVRAAAK